MPNFTGRWRRQTWSRPDTSGAEASADLERLRFRLSPDHAAEDLTRAVSDCRPCDAVHRTRGGAGPRRIWHCEVTWLVKATMGAGGAYLWRVDPARRGARGLICIDLQG